VGKYFGTDGFRGRANETLTAVHAFRIGRFLGYYYAGTGKKPKIVVGKDTRLSSYTLEYALSAGATASGADVYLLHVTTTPSVSYTVCAEGFDCGVMISASHNPYCDNGIKLINEKGEKMDDSVIFEAEKFLEGGELPFASGKNIGRTVDYVAGRNRYLAFLLSLPRRSFRGLKIGLDCANGSSWAIGKAVFDALGAETFVTGASPNGVNINEGCGSTCIANLQGFVIDNGLDLGFAFDGDADRCICVDEKGGVIDGDGILYVCAKYFKSSGELDGGGVVATKMSNFGLAKALEREGISLAFADVGDRFVYAEMARTGYLLGGEASGHVIFRKHETTGDGLVTALKLTEIVLESKCPISCLTEGYRPLPQVIKNISTFHKVEISQDFGVKNAIKEAETLCRGRALLRVSGTENVVRILMEGENLKEGIALVEQAIKEAEERLCAE